MINVPVYSIGFDVENPRFAGLSFEPLDINPYGKSIEKMKESMIETYNKTGSLLLQPIVCAQIDSKYYVRAGFTRALAFITKYDELCNALGKEDLTIPVMILEGLNIVDAIMENMMRTNQHFMATANAIKMAVEIKGTTIKKIADQIGVSTNKAAGLKKIASLPKSITSLCYRDVIDEAGALSLVGISERILEIFADYINEEGVKHANGKDLAKSLFKTAFKSIPEWIPTDAFIDLEGNAHPDIKEEPWFISVEGLPYDLEDNSKTTDINAMNARSRAYYQMFVEREKITIVDRMDCYSMNQVKMGTHPEEVACWDYQENYIAFYLRQSSIDKLNQNEKSVDAKKASLLEKVDRKIIAMKQEARVKYMKEKVELLATTDSKVNRDMISFYGFSILFSQLRSAVKESLKLLTGKIYDTAIEMFEENGVYSFELLSAAYMMNDWTISAAHKKLFDDNGINWENDIECIYTDIDFEKKEMLAKAEEKGDCFETDVANIAAFLTDMHFIYDIEKSMFLIDAIDDLNESALKYIARNINIPYKGSEALMRMRINSALKVMTREMNIKVDEDFKLKAVTSVGIINDTLDTFMSGAEDHTAKDYTSYLNICMGSLRNKILLDNENIKFNEKDGEKILKEINKTLALKKMLYRGMLSKKDSMFIKSVCFTNDKGKITIL